MSSLKEKHIRTITIILGVVGAVLISIIGFNIFQDQFANAENITPQNVTISDITSSGAIIKWTTARETQSVVEYGTSPTSLTFFAPESIKTKEHEVELNLLTSETTYYFQIATGDKTFNNGGVPWTFTTLGKDSLTQKPTKTPSPEQDTSPSPSQSPTQPPDTTGSAEKTDTPSPTNAQSTENKDTECIASEYINNFNKENPKYDQNNDGVINGADFSLCNANKQGNQGSETPTPDEATNSPTPDEASTPTLTP